MPASILSPAMTGSLFEILVSYNSKHNEANIEDNRDGTDDNVSWNFGLEGDSDDPSVNGQRRKQMKNILTTLFLSQGVPMMLGGDEMTRTQKGNNNAYCQDNEISWFNWNLGRTEEEMLDFTRKLDFIPKRTYRVPKEEILSGQKALRRVKGHYLASA